MQIRVRELRRVTTAGTFAAWSIGFTAEDRPRQPDCEPLLSNAVWSVEEKASREITRPRTYPEATAKGFVSVKIDYWHIDNMVTDRIRVMWVPAGSGWHKF